MLKEIVQNNNGVETYEPRGNLPLSHTQDTGEDTDGN